MQIRVVVVALDIISDHEFFDIYMAIPAHQKLSLLMGRLNAVCAELLVKEPHAKWLVVWPEHGISNTARNCLNAEEKNAFKQALQQVTAQYEQLTIIAGTVPTVREYERARTRSEQLKIEAKFDGIAGAYANSRWIKIVENVEGFGDYFVAYEQFFAEKRHLERRALIRNTAYVFMGGECIARHDKSAPFRELSRYDGDFGMFQIAKGRNIGTHLMLQYADGVKIPICIEICREHAIGVAMREYELGQYEQPVIHFVLADTIRECRDNMMGDYFMLVDTSFLSELEQRNDSPYTVVQYHSSMLEMKLKLNLFEEDIDEGVRMSPNG